MRHTFLVSVILIWQLQVQAQDTAHFSLNRILNQVEANDPSILKYQNVIQSLDSKAEGANAWMPPTFSTGLMRFPYQLIMLNERNNPMNQAGIPFSIEQMIPNARKLKSKKNYLSSLSDVEKSKREWTKNELRREVKILYYTRYVAEKKQIILQESAGLLKLLLSTAEEKFSNNQSQLQTIFKARGRLAEISNMQSMLKGTISESNIGLNILMVRDVNAEIQIDTLITPEFYSDKTLDTGNVSSRSDIAGMSKYIQSMQLEQKVMKLGYKPDFGIRGEHAIMFGMPNQWTIMGMVTIPIVPWSSKMYLSETKSMGFQIQAMQQEKQKMELMANRMIAEKNSMLRFETDQYQNYQKEIIPAFKNSLQANLLAYKQNTGDFFLLLDAWEMLLMKKLETFDKLFTVLKLEAEYEYEKEIK